MNINISQVFLDLKVAHFTMRTKDENIEHLKEGDLLNKVASHSQRIFTVIWNNDL